MNHRALVTASRRFSQALAVLTIASLVAIALDIRYQAQCFAPNIHYEAATEPRLGKEAVGFVTFIRAQRGPPEFPGSPCGVVYQPRAFSWTLDPEKVSGPLPKMSGETIEIAHQFARLWALRADPEVVGITLGLTKDAFFYKRHDWNEHDPNEKRMSESNKWFWKMCLEPLRNAQNEHVRIGAHVFYRAKGGVCPKYAPPTTQPKRPEVKTDEQKSGKGKDVLVPPLQRVPPKNPDTTKQ